MADDHEGTDGPVAVTAGVPTEQDAAQPQPVPRASIDKGSAQTSKHAEDEDEEEEEEDADMSFLRNRSRGGMLLVVSDKQKQDVEAPQSQAAKPEESHQNESEECGGEEVVTVGVQLTQSPVERKAEMSETSAKGAEVEPERHDQSATGVGSAEAAQQDSPAVEKPESDHVVATDESQPMRKQENGPVESEAPPASVDLPVAKEMEDGTLTSKVVREHRTTTVKVEASGQGLETTAQDMAEQVLRKLEDNMSNLQASGLSQGFTIQRTAESTFASQNKTPAGQLPSQAPTSEAQMQTTFHGERSQPPESTALPATVTTSGSAEKAKPSEPDSWVVPIPIKVEVPFPEASQTAAAQPGQTTMQSMSSTVTMVTTSSTQGPPTAEPGGRVIPITVSSESQRTQLPGEGTALPQETPTVSGFAPSNLEASQPTKQAVPMDSSGAEDKRAVGQEIPIPIKVESVGVAKEPQATAPSPRQTPQPTATVMPSSVQVTVQPGQTTKQTISRTETRKTYITNKQESASNWIQQESVSKNNWISGAPWSRSPRTMQPTGTFPSAKHFFQETKTTRTEQFRSDGRSAPQHTVSERKEVYTDGDQQLSKMADQTRGAVTQPQEQISFVKQQWSAQGDAERQDVQGTKPVSAAAPSAPQQQPSPAHAQSTIRQQWTAQGAVPAGQPGAQAGWPFNAAPSFTGPDVSQAPIFTQQATPPSGVPVRTESSYSKQQWSRHTRNEAAYPQGTAPQAPFPSAATPENAANEFQRYFESVQQNAPPGSQFRSETKFSKQQWSTQGSSPVSPRIGPGADAGQGQRAVPQQQSNVQYTEQSADGGSYNVRKEVRKTYVQSGGPNPVYGQTPADMAAPSPPEQHFHSAGAQAPTGPFGRMPITRTVTSSWTSRFNRETSGNLPGKEVDQQTLYDQTSIPKQQHWSVTTTKRQYDTSSTP